MSHICKYCGYKFDRKYNMQRHIESQHSLMMDEEDTENSDEDENHEESEDDTVDTKNNDDDVLSMFSSRPAQPQTHIHAVKQNIFNPDHSL